MGVHNNFFFFFDKTESVYKLAYLSKPLRIESEAYKYNC